MPDWDDNLAATKRFGEGATGSTAERKNVKIDRDAGALVLQVMNTELAGRKYVCPVGVHVIGRMDTCDHCIPHATVSRKHCTLFVREDEVRIKDEDSAHGLQINGEPVKFGFLKENDMLQLGDVSMLVDVNLQRRLRNRDSVFFPKPRT